MTDKLEEANEVATDEAAAEIAATVCKAPDTDHIQSPIVLSVVKKQKSYECPQKKPGPSASYADATRSGTTMLTQGINE